MDSQTIAPANIMSAAVVMQVCLGLIFGCGAWSVRWREDARFQHEDKRLMPWIILATTILTLLALSFSAPFSPLWRPLIGDVSFQGIDGSTALLITFVIDIIATTLLMAETGGSTESIFVPVLFALPAIAIFLREAGSHLILYVALVVAAFSFGFGFQNYRSSRLGLWLVAIFCLLLTTGIGYTTRPR